LALRLGLAKLGHVALDGTKLRANTSKHKAMSYGRMRQREAQLKDEIARLVERAAARDDAEDQEYGADSDGYSVDEELALRAARRAKIRALRERLAAEERAEQGLADDQAPAIDPTAQRSFADGDARMMLLKRGEYADAYNAQAAVDELHGVIVAADLTNVVPDQGHLPVRVDEVRRLRAIARLGDDAPTMASADAGYFSLWGVDIRPVSCGEALVFVDESAEAIAAADFADRGIRLTAGNWRAQLERAMWAHRVVVLDVRAQDPFQVALAEDEQPVQAFAPNRPDPALGMGPGAGCLERRADDTHALGAEHLVEGSRELGVAVPDQQRRACVRVVGSPAELAGLLGHPRGARMRGAAGDEDTARVDLEDEQHVHSPQPDDQRRLHSRHFQPSSS
jgi:hypothetical protein